MVEIAWRTLNGESGVISTYGVKLMSDKIKRYPDNDRNNDDDIRIGHGQQIIPDNVAPLHQRFVTSPHDEKDKGKKETDK
ncbi:hypothetical protein RNH31_004409 [Salmonella enterica]|nr:hypothetical protein [Salmonella enterica]